MAGLLGYWFGGLAMTMLGGYILLRFAASPKRKPSTAVTLRVLAVLLAFFLVFLGYKGSQGDINPGGVLALVVICVWAIAQHKSRQSLIVSNTTAEDR